MSTYTLIGIHNDSGAQYTVVLTAANGAHALLIAKEIADNSPDLLIIAVLAGDREPLNEDVIV